MRAPNSTTVPAAVREAPSLRCSLYTLVVEVGGNTSLLLHQPKGSVDQLPSLTAQQILQNPASLDEALTEYLLSRGYLTNRTDVEEEKDLIEQVRRIEKENAAEIAAPLFSFITTYSCNLACPYCFQANTGVRAAPVKRMTVEAAQTFVAIVANAPQHPTSAFVELFGGEPLLPALRPVVEEIVLGVEKNGYFTRVTTNGTGLSAYLDLLGPTRIAELQISLDGSRRFHDQRRIGIGGAPTFDRIWNNICEALNRNCRVMIRANLDRRNLDGFLELAEFIDSEGLLDHPLCSLTYVDVKPDPIAPDYGFDASMPKADIEAYLATQSDRHPVVEKIAATNGTDNFGSWLTDNFLRHTTRHCGAVTKNVYFSPDGLVYSCHETAGRPEHAIGHVEGHQIVYNDIAQRWRSRRVDDLAECRRCPYALTCSGGCAARMGLLNDPLQGYCNGFDATFRSALRRQYQATCCGKEVHEQRGGDKYE